MGEGEGGGVVAGGWGRVDVGWVDGDSFGEEGVVGC